MIYKFGQSMLEHWKGIDKSKEAIFHGILIGIIVGFSILGYEFIINNILIENLKKIDTYYWFLLPLIGFLILNLISVAGKIQNPSMADEIVKSYHNGSHDIKV